MVASRSGRVRGFVVALLSGFLGAGLTPAAGAQPAAPADPVLTGSVKEAISAGEYTFLRLSTASGEVWAAVPIMEANRGDRVDILDGFLVVDFFSNQLQRRFDRIYLGSAVRVAPAGGE